MQRSGSLTVECEATADLPEPLYLYIQMSNPGPALVWMTAVNGDRRISEVEAEDCKPLITNDEPITVFSDAHYPRGLFVDVMG